MPAARVPAIQWACGYGAGWSRFGTRCERVLMNKLCFLNSNTRTSGRRVVLVLCQGAAEH